LHTYYYTQNGFRNFSVSRKRQTKELLDEVSSDERLQDPESVFRVQVFYPVVDTTVFQLQSRFEEQHLVSKIFSFLFPKYMLYLLQLSDEDLGKAAKKLHDAYSTDIDSDIVSEVRSFGPEFKKEIEGSNSTLLREPIIDGCYLPWHPFWHTMHIVFICYSTPFLSLVLVLSNKQTKNQQTLDLLILMINSGIMSSVPKLATG
jgi:hypothetical protein